MSDIKALEAQIDRLIQSGFAQVESNRLLSSSVEVVSAKVGRLCDEMKEFVEQTNERQRESERNIRVLRTEFDDFKRRFKPVEEDFKKRARATR